MKTSVNINVSPGEVIDKIIILELKAEYITCSSSLVNVHHELNYLRERAASLGYPPSLLKLLKDCNKKIWQAEEVVREKEKKKEFDAAFIKAARDVYLENDKRGELKKEINLFLNSEYIEEKSHDLDYNE